MKRDRNLPLAVKVSRCREKRVCFVNKKEKKWGVFF